MKNREKLTPGTIIKGKSGEKWMYLFNEWTELTDCGVNQDYVYYFAEMRCYGDVVGFTSEEHDSHIMLDSLDEFLEGKTIFKN